MVFATHNIGLARATAESVYTFQKRNSQPSQVSEFGATPRLSEFLGELSFFGYKELGVSME
jgi:hypothetical protein